MSSARALLTTNDRFTSPSRPPKAAESSLKASACAVAGLGDASSFAACRPDGGGGEPAAAGLPLGGGGEPPCMRVVAAAAREALLVCAAVLCKTWSASADTTLASASEAGLAGVPGPTARLARQCR